MVSPIRDAAINGMVEELLAPPPKAQFTIKKKVAICKAASLLGESLNIPEHQLRGGVAFALAC